MTRIDLLRICLIVTDSDAVQREEEAIKLDGLNVAQLKEIREKVCLFYVSQMVHTPPSYFVFVVTFKKVNVLRVSFVE